MKTSCPFTYCMFSVDENIAKIKPFDIRIPCYEAECPAQLWEPILCINPSASEDARRYIGGHCKYLINICEQCEHLKKCKKVEDARDSCRQERIDLIFRINLQESKTDTQKPTRGRPPSQSQELDKPSDQNL